MVELNLKNGVYWHLSAVETDTSDFHSGLVCAMTSKEEEMIALHAAWTEVLQLSVTTH